MGKHIAILQGHPDPHQGHLCHALAQAYADGARHTGHTVTTITVATLDFPWLRTQTEWVEGDTPPGLLEAQKTILDADHLVLIYPLWLGTMPAVLKGFLEQVIRPRLANEKMGLDPNADVSFTGFKKMLQGKSCRVVVTMGMPAAFYRFFFFAHSLKNLERNILKFVGIKPVRTTLYGMVESSGAEKRQNWIEEMRELGAKGV